MSALHVGFGAAVLVLVFGGLWLLTRAAATLRREGGPGLDHRVRLLERREALGEELRTAELDFRMGRIDRAAYEQERSRLDPQLVDVLQQLDVLERAAEEPA